MSTSLCFSAFFFILSAYIGIVNKNFHIYSIPIAVCCYTCYNCKEVICLQKASPLYAQIRDYLLEMIQQNRQTPNFRLPSENQLAIKFGASRISAKHALDALEQEGLIYRQQGRGSFIRSSTAPAVAAAKGFFPGGIALITSFISTLFMSDMIQGIREELAARGLESVVFITDNNQEKEVEYLCAAQEYFQGALLFPGAFATYHEELLKMVINHYPLVQIDRYLPGLDLSYVACDHFDATYQAVQFLQRRGHTRIGFVGHLLGHASSIVERCGGFDKATREQDSAYPNDFRLNVDDGMEDFDQFFLRYMQRMRPTAIISSSHLHGPETMRMLKEMHIDQKVELMLYDNEFSIAKEFLGYHPFIIDQQPRQIGQTAAHLLYKLIDENGKPEKIRLPARIYQV